MNLISFKLIDKKNSFEKDNNFFSTIIIQFHQ